MYMLSYTCMHMLYLDSLSYSLDYSTFILSLNLSSSGCKKKKAAATIVSLSQNFTIQVHIVD